VLEKFGFHASGAKALEEKKELIAALKALRHPKPPPKTGDAAAPENRRLLPSKAELSPNRLTMKLAIQTVEI
jgi:hypothetical protein